MEQVLSVQVVVASNGKIGHIHQYIFIVFICKHFRSIWYLMVVQVLFRRDLRLLRNLRLLVLAVILRPFSVVVLAGRHREYIVFKHVEQRTNGGGLDPVHIDDEVVWLGLCVDIEIRRGGINLGKSIKRTVRFLLERIGEQLIDPLVFFLYLQLVVNQRLDINLHSVIDQVFILLDLGLRIEDDITAILDIERVHQQSFGSSFIEARRGFMEQRINLHTQILHRLVDLAQFVQLAQRRAAHIAIALLSFLLFLAVFVRCVQRIAVFAVFIAVLLVDAAQHFVRFTVHGIHSISVDLGSGVDCMRCASKRVVGGHSVHRVHVLFVLLVAVGIVIVCVRVVVVLVAVVLDIGAGVQVGDLFDVVH
mmetsp:Transcript_15220/g.23901  ORF Transcript_15220/g.23901 Transcript_15220/m.23901 type:complete len:363 (+) Transcript_15220:72-1160(+)